MPAGHLQTCLFLPLSLTRCFSTHPTCTHTPHPHCLPAGKLDAELVAATRRVSGMLQKLPREITPVNLEELRRVKQLLVELESKAENMRWVGGCGWKRGRMVGRLGLLEALHRWIYFSPCTCPATLPGGVNLLLPLPVFISACLPSLSSFLPPQGLA